MSIKQSKCQQMFVTSQKSFNNKKYVIPAIPLNEKIRILGVDFDGILSLKSHVNRTCKKASSRLFALRQLRSFT